MSNFLEDIELASKINEEIKKAEQRGIDNSIELTKEIIKQQYGDVKLLQERIDKAIEYIKKYLPNYDFDHSNLEKVLEILVDKGEDK